MEVHRLEARGVDRGDTRRHVAGPQQRHDEMREVAADASAAEQRVHRTVGRQAASRLVRDLPAHPGRDCREDGFGVDDASELPPGDLGQPVGLRVAARPQVDEPLVLSAGGGGRVPDDRRRVGDDETSRRHLEHVCAAAVCAGNLARRDRRSVEANVENLVDAQAGGDRDLKRDLGAFADLELEPCRYCATHGR